jgi:hypothetical protein
MIGHVTFAPAFCRASGLSDDLRSGACAGPNFPSPENPLEADCRFRHARSPPNSFGGAVPFFWSPTDLAHRLQPVSCFLSWARLNTNTKTNTFIHSAVAGTETPAHTFNRSGPTIGRHGDLDSMGGLLSLAPPRKSLGSVFYDWETRGRRFKSSRSDQ